MLQLPYNHIIQVFTISVGAIPAQVKVETNLVVSLCILLPF